MGIFSIFNKKKTDTDSKAEPEPRQRSGESSRLPDTEADRARQREVARATAAKIDAIESAMSNDIFNTPEPAWGSGPRRPRSAAPAAEAGADTLPILEQATTELLADDEQPDTPVFPQTAPVIEEIAIMFANDQIVVAEHMLLEALAEIGKADRTIWWMLFDLYQISDRQDDFDNIAIDYASQFETSPPSWAPPLLPPATENRSYAGVTPSEVFSGVLDGQVAARLERLVQKADGGSPVLRLEFARIQEVTPEGCALLLDTLTKLHKSQRELIVAGASEFSDLVRSGIEIGQRDASEAPWLLLLALLQLQNREKDFEETAMDYCVTYEVSPPSFEAPSKVATAASLPAPVASERFMLPSVIQGGGNQLFDAIDAYAAGTETVLIDCSRLGRVDYAAAGALLIRLRAISAEKKIELRELNHLVAALFKLLGFTEAAKLFPHKY